MFAKFNLKYEASRMFNRTFNEREVSDFLTMAELELVKQRYAAFRNTKGIGMNNNDIPQARTVRSAELSGLLSGTAKISYTNMIAGTDANGALYNSDLDATDIESYGVFVPIPDEAMYILSESVDTVKDVSIPTVKKKNVPVREVSLEEYHRGVYDYYARPYDNLTWSMDWGSYTASTITATGSGLFTDSSKDYTLTGVDYNMMGKDVLGTGLDIYINTARSRYLIPGKDWYIYNYQCYYLKRPKAILVDLITPSNQQNCELAEFLHDEVVDLAVELASASITPEQSKYSINSNEAVKNE